MELSPVELLTQYGVMGSLLGVILYWLLKHYLPESQQQHRAEVERLLAAHEQSVARLSAAVERNTRVVQFVSQALLVQSFAQNGLDGLEAEQIARRIQFTTLCGCEGESPDPPGA